MKYDIISVTMNPALDREIYIKNFECGKHFGTENQKRNKIIPGGKGINVSLMLSQLGITSLNMGFLGGFIGNEIMNFLGDVQLITTNFIQVDEETRVNIRIIDNETKKETTIDSSGPEISMEDYKYFLKRYEACLDLSSNVVISGSVPPGILDNTYAELFDIAHKKGLRTFMDGTGIHFDMAIALNCPKVVKADMRKRNKILDVEIKTISDCVKAGNYVLGKGAEIVVINFEHNSFYAGTPEGGWIFRHDSLDNKSYGIGDAFMSGIIYGYKEGLSLFETAKSGMACAVSKVKFIGKKIGGKDNIISEINSFNIDKIY